MNKDKAKVVLLKTENGLIGNGNYVDVHLISFARNNSVIWDKTHQDYKNVILKEQKWKDLAEFLNLTANEAKKRWKTIRDRYLRLLKINCTHKYKYGNILKFLDALKFAEQENIYYCYSENELDETLETKIELEQNNHMQSPREEDDELHIFDSQSEYSTLNNEPKPKRQRTSSNGIAVAIEDNADKFAQDDQDKFIFDFINTLKSTIHMETTTKSPIELFMQSLAMQLNEANLSSSSLLNLQINLLKCLQESIECEAES